LGDQVAHVFEPCSPNDKRKSVVYTRTIE
jgi:hypothetical protein